MDKAQSVEEENKKQPVDDKQPDTSVELEETDQSKLIELGQEENIFDDIQYICGSTSLITNSLQDGCDVAQLPNGDIIVTEVVTVNVLYTWDKAKQKMIKVSQS